MEKTKRFAGYMVVLLVVGALLGWSLQSGAASNTLPVKMIPENFSDLAEKARPGVVNIRTVRSVKGGGPVFRHFFGNPFGGRSPFDEFLAPQSYERPVRDFKQQSLGSGFFIDGKGHIVTNNHVIEGADEIKVKLANGKEFDAKVVGRDPKTDLALIRIKASDDLRPLELGNSDTLRVGRWVLAIGSPFGLEQTVTAGIVSAKGRVIGAGPYDDFIQTDASINPGNSGGPLLNIKGEVVGINTAIMSRDGGNNGIGFAIPINLAKGIIEQLKNEGGVNRAWLGVAIQDLTPELAAYYKVKDRKGALVTHVNEGDPADKGGIKPGDVIIAVDGDKVSSSRELSITVANASVGARIPITIVRDGKEQSIYVELVKRVDLDDSLQAEARNSKDLGLQVTVLKPEIARQLGLPENEKGVVVTKVQPGGKGDLAGIQQGDVIKEVDRKPVSTPADIKNQIDRVQSGDTVQMLIKKAHSELVVVKVTV
jgi:serine protease Do